jgi:sulfur carrier protein
MQVQVNGKPHSLENSSISLVEFLRVQGFDPEMNGIAVAINFSVIPRSTWAETVVNEGDAIEVIGALQGG